MSLLNPPNVRLTAKLSSKGVPAFSAVNTMMNQPLNQETIDSMDVTVKLLIVKKLGHTIDTSQGHIDLLNDNIHMVAVDKEFKYGKGKEIIAFADGGKGTTGKDLKYVKFFYWYDTNKPNVKGSDKTYSYSVEKARTFWNNKVAEGYTRFDVLPEVKEITGPIPPTLE